MAEKNMKARIVHKHDVEANWLKATNFIPMKGEIIVYDIDDTYNYERFKIGDGKTLVSALPFADDAVKESIAALNTTIGGVDSKVDAVSALVGDTAVSTQISSALAGNAGSATKLATARKINGVSFNGTSDITITADPTPNNLTSEDLDDIKTPGYYFAGGSNTTTNRPDDVSAFGLVVYKTADGYVTQELTGGNNSPNKKFIRTYAGTVWGDWQVIYTSAYPQVHVGPTEPTDPNVTVWINTAEEGTGVVPVLPRIATITLAADAWTGSSEPYSQVVEINTVTTASKIDLQPTAQQIVSLQNAEISLMVENNGGVVTCYAIGNKPTVDYTMQVLIQEVSYV